MSFSDDSNHERHIETPNFDHKYSVKSDEMYQFAESYYYNRSEDNFQFQYIKMQSFFNFALFVAVIETVISVISAAPTETGENPGGVSGALIATLVGK